MRTAPGRGQTNVDASHEPPPTRAPVRPVLLLTIDVALAVDALSFAVETALETGAELFVCDAVPIPIGQITNSATRTLGNLLVVAEHQQVARDAAAAGVRVRTMVFSSPRPLRATVTVLRDKGVGLLVFGPDRRAYGRWRFSRHAAFLRRQAPCLVWPFG
jgi:hypothetical protein